MAQSDVDNGDLNVVIGLAPVTPPEFVIIAIAAFAGPAAAVAARSALAMEATGRRGLIRAQDG
jgi:hypothetical protein